MCRVSSGQARSLANEIPLRPVRQPDEAPVGRATRPWLAVGRATRARSAATRWRCSPTRTRRRSSSRSACGSAPRLRSGQAPRRMVQRRHVRERMPVQRDDARDRRTRAGPSASPQPHRAGSRTCPAVRWTAGAEARLANIPEFIRPMARTGIEQIRQGQWNCSKSTRRSSMRRENSSACKDLR